MQIQENPLSFKITQISNINKTPNKRVPEDIQTIIEEKKVYLICLLFPINKPPFPPIQIKTIFKTKMFKMYNISKVNTK